MFVIPAFSGRILGVSPAQAIGLASQFVLASVFIAAGLAKAASFSRFQSTLQGLGLGDWLSRALGSLLIIVEISIAIALVVAPNQVVPRIFVVGLVITFAVAGMFALTTHRNVPCNCIGKLGTGLLGWRQIILFPLWILLATVAQMANLNWPPEEGLSGLALILVSLVGPQAVGTYRLSAALRVDRLAINVPLLAAATRGITTVRTEDS